MLVGGGGGGVKWAISQKRSKIYAFPSCSTLNSFYY